MTKSQEIRRGRERERKKTCVGDHAGVRHIGAVDNTCLIKVLLTIVFSTTLSVWAPFLTENPVVTCGEIANLGHGKALT